MALNLFELRDQLVAKLRGLPGFLTVGIGRQKEDLVFVVSIDSGRYKGGTPATYHGYGVLVRDLGEPVGHASIA